MESNLNIKFETKSIKETANILNVDINQGLDNQEAYKRNQKYGENKLNENKKKSPIKIFFEQMNNPMIFVLFGATAITLIVSIYETIKAGYFDFINVGDWADVVIILAVVFLNSIIGTIQELKATSSLEALKKLSSPLVNVIRSGKNIKIKSSELTLGDIVLLEDGDIIAADMRLIESHNLKVNESSLTGESVPVEKNASLVFNKETSLGDRLNYVYSSTIVTYGRGKAIVTNIGMNTEIGKIAKTLNEEGNELTPLQKVLAKLSKSLGIVTLIIIGVVMLASMTWIFVKGSGSNIEVWIEMILDAIALAVAAIPEGLVAVVTIVLALGVTRMVKANTIVRKLPSVETLGSVNVICSDKTGTLTQNKMTVMSAYVDDTIYKELKNDKSLDFLAKGMCLCSNATLDYGDPTEIALVAFANKLGFDKKVLEKDYPRLDELPFDSDRKMMSVRNDDYVLTKGSLDSVIARCKNIVIKGKIRELTKKDIDAIYNANGYYASRALRVLALAYSSSKKLEEKNLIFVGLVAMIDPPRLEVKEAVKTLKRAGIRTIMITGDYKDTAFAIAKELGIADNANECLSGGDIDKLTKDELIERVKHVSVFARVSPQNKVDIVKAVKASDNIVAMTGDGVNDAPSLKSADIGIAMGITGTDVAKDASDMVLTDDNFASIEKAVEEGRGIFTNIKKSVLFLLSSNISEVLTMFIIICVGLASPLVAIHLLWINLITDSIPAIALGVNPKDKNVMDAKPRKKYESFFSHGGIKVTFGYGIIITIGVVIAYFIPAWIYGAYSFSAIRDLYNQDHSVYLLTARSMAFSTLAFSELFHMLGMSNLDKSFVCIFKNKNWLMYLAFFIGFLLQIFVVQVPGVNNIFKTKGLDITQWLIVLGLSFMPLLVHEVVVLIKFLHKKVAK